jgi:DNA polymerase-3 subunit gamma/tau
MSSRDSRHLLHCRAAFMSYTVLARRYRSATFDQIVGQEQIAQTLKKAIETGRLAHAYLFCGTRGTGKTSTARILAKCLNCQSKSQPVAVPCNACDSCRAIDAGVSMSVQEIDAASHTGVDNVREIIEDSRNSAADRFRIFIIDEVHMLSKSAFNALLKTLEEPPAHVKFILATTEPEKVLPTILSRCQRYDFRNISARQIAQHLAEICKQEKVSADADALALLARAGAGSMRDALSLLDRLLSLGEKKLTAATVEQVLGLPRSQAIGQLAGAIAAADVKQTLALADGMINSGLSSDALIVALADHLRNLLVALTCGADSALLDLPGHSPAELVKQAQSFEPVALSQDIAILEELRRNLRQNQTGRALLDATLVRLALAGQFTSIGQLLSRQTDGPASAPAPAQKKNPEPVEIASPPATAAEPPLPAAMEPPPTPPTLDDEADIWTQLLAKLESQTSSLASALRLARFGGVENDRAVIHFPHHCATFAKAFAANGKRDAIANALSDLRGKPTGVRFDVDEDAAGAVPSAPSPTGNGPSIPPEIQGDPLVQWVLREFGGKIERVE